MQKSMSAPQIEDVRPKTTGRKAGLFARVFGCRHNRMSRPVTTDCVTYKYCAACGIRRRFDPVTYEPIGRYYYPDNESELYYF